MSEKIRHILSIFAVTSFLIIAFGSDDEKTTETEILAYTPAISVSARELYADYEANGVAADEKYKGKVLRVTGVVNNIDRDVLDKIYVTLSGNDYYGDIQCFFAENHVQTAAQLSKGQTITVKGKCDGKMMNVLLRGCTFE